MRLLQDLRALRASWFELLQGDDGAERRASYELAVSARRFSRSARRVVDDKLAFSATLMRAGEVHAAHRLLEEVEREVRTEEAALLERVNEVTIAQVARRERMTRVRLARTLAVAMLGSSVMAFSAAGMAVAGMFQDRAESHSPLATGGDDDLGGRLATAPAPVDGQGRVHGGIQNVKIKGKNVILTESDLRLVEQLASGDVTFASVEQILNMLPAQVRNMIADVNDATPARETADKILRAVAKKKRKDRAQQPPAPTPTEQPSQQPSEQPATQPSEEPSEKPSSSPSPSNDPAPASDDDDNGDDSESNDGSGAGTEEQNTPIPVIDPG